MKKWVCAMLCLSMVAGLAAVDAKASADYEPNVGGENMGVEKEEKIVPQRQDVYLAAVNSPAPTPTASPGTETAPVDTSPVESVKPGQVLPPTQPPIFTGNKVVNEESVFSIIETDGGKSCTITGYNGDMGVTTLYIPKQINKKTVTAVADGVFARCPFLKNVVVQGDPEFQGTGVFAPASGVELWGKTGGKASVYAAAGGLAFHVLDGPAKISSQKDADMKGASVTWEAVNGAVSYAVYRKQGKGAYAICKETEGVSYVNSGLKPGATYTYKVIPFFKASNGDRIEGLASKETSVSMAPSKLKGVKATGIRGGIRVKWKRNKSVSGYQVFMKVHVKGFKTKFNRIKTTKSNKTTSYICKMLVRNMKYSYRVRPFVKVNGKKIFGPYVTVTTRAK